MHYVYGDGFKKNQIERSMPGSYQSKIVVVQRSNFNTDRQSNPMWFGLSESVVQRLYLYEMP